MTAADELPASFPVPQNLREGVGSDPLAGTGWLASLPSRVASLAGRWGLTVGDPFQPGGNCAWVAPATDADGRDLVLKVGWTHDEARDEAEGLAAFGGEGAVEVYAFDHDGDTTSLLLERCRPGVELRTRPEPEQDEVIAELLRRLWAVPLRSDHPFRPLSAMATRWADEAEEKFARFAMPADPGLVRAGLDAFRSLPGSADREALLCTDLHAGNVLSGTRAPWLLIDPKPYVGDPHYDITQHLLNCDRRLAEDPVGLVDRVAGLARLDRARARRWTFARCVQEGPENPAFLEAARRLAD